MKYEWIVFFSALLTYTVSAWFSSGFLHGDEHYQLIEFAAFKMGNVSANRMAWEFEAMIRPGLQPLIAYLAFKLLLWVSISDPYIQMFILRMLTVILAVFSIRFFTRSCRDIVHPRHHTIFLVLSYFLWFMPFVNVRFSSETWSGIMLLIALAIQLNKNSLRGKYLIIGGLLGLSFLFRYQNAFLAFGFILWLLVIRRETLLNLLKMMSVILGVVLLGILIDYWLYGQFTLSAWNYFYVNLVEDVSSGFGTEKWWNYFYSIFRFSFFPIGTLVVLGFLIFIIKKPRSILTWTILPFFIIHSIIPHKELRFLFPVINLLPLMLIVAYQELKWEPGKWNRIWAYSFKVLLLIIFCINCIGTLTVILKPADGGLMTITKHIRRNYGIESIRLISYNNSNPYGPWGLMASFYMEKDMQDIRIESLSDLDAGILDDERVNLLVLKRQDSGSEIGRAYIKEQNLEKKVQCIPEWMEPLMTLYGGFKIREILEVYELPPK